MGVLEMYAEDCMVGAWMYVVMDAETRVWSLNSAARRVY